MKLLDNRRAQIAIIICAVSLVFILPVVQFIRLQAASATKPDPSIKQVEVKSQAPTIGQRRVTSAVARKPVSHSFIPVGKVSTDQAQIALPIIARCESGNDPLAKNSASSAKGLLQIIDSTWDDFGCVGNVLSREDNYRCGLKIATQSGLHHWNPSRACWYRDVRLGLKTGSS